MSRQRITADLPIGEAMAQWNDARYRRNEIAINTYRATRGVARRFGEFLGDDVTVADVSEHDVEDWISSMDVVPRTRNVYCATVRQFFGWAVRRELITRDPTLDVANAKTPLDLPRKVADADIEAVLNAADFRARVMITIAVTLGLRRAEIAGMQVEDWDRETDVLLIRGKGSKERTSAVEGDAKAALTAWVMTLGRSSGPMWPSRVRPGECLSANQVGRIVIEPSEKAGLHITPHQYRHSMASTWIMSGVPLEAVRRQLGHSSIATTGRYLFADVEQLRGHVGVKSYGPSWSPESTPAPPKDEDADPLAETLRALFRRTRGREVANAEELATFLAGLQTPGPGADVPDFN